MRKAFGVLHFGRFNHSLAIVVALYIRELNQRVVMWGLMGGRTRNIFIV